MIPSDPSQTDPQIVALMAGLKSNEGANGNYNATGDEGTAAGIGMWSNETNGKPQPLKAGEVPANFAADASKHGLDPSDFSPANQNKVMYAVLADDKKQGLSPEQALSKWNSGDKNAYQTSPVEKSSVSASGTSDVGAYVQKGMAKAQAFAKSKGSPTGQVLGDSTTAPSPGGIPITPLGGNQSSPPQTGGIPITSLQIPSSAQLQGEQSVPAMQSPFPLENIASGNGANGKQRFVGAAKGLLQTMSEIGGTSGGNPVVNAMLKGAPAFNKDIQAANAASQPTNQIQKQSVTETQLGAGLLAGAGTANLVSDAFSGAVPAVKGIINTAETYAKANPIKSAVTAYVVTNLLKNTKVGAAIEKATGIKGLLDLL